MDSISFFIGYFVGGFIMLGICLWGFSNAIKEYYFEKNQPKKG